MRLNQLTPMLSLHDLKRTIRFYRDDLGFSCVRTFGELQPIVEPATAGE